MTHQNYLIELDILEELPRLLFSKITLPGFLHFK